MAAIAEQLANYLVDLTYQDLPGPVTEKAKHCILDSVGCMVGGVGMPSSQALLLLLEKLGGKREALVAGTRLRLSIPWAAYGNAYLANVLDFEDTYIGMGHPGPIIIPAAITLADALDVPGPALLAAVVAGYEISLRVGTAIRASKGVEAAVGHATYGIFGAAAVAGKLIGLNREQMAHAMALAAVNAPVPAIRKSGRKERPYAWIKNNCGWGVLGGLVAAQLAGNGFRGNLTIFDGDTGFWRMVGSDCCNWAAFTAQLGERYLIREVSFKPYPSCRRTHATADAIGRIMAEHRLDPQTIQCITVETDSDMVEDFMVYDPVDIIDAQYSLPYVAAMAALRYPPGLTWSQSENLTDPVVKSMMRRIRARDVAGLKGRAESGFQVKVIVEATSGKMHEAAVLRPLGDPDAPLSYEQLAAKFMGLCEPTLHKKAQQALRAIECLEASPGGRWVAHLQAGTPKKKNL
jgi:2-methylcitrate dehydratase PrpD